MYEIFKNALKGESTEEPTEPVEEYPEYVKPTGAHDAYKIGDKITYNGKRYECHLMYAYGIQMNTQRDGKRL